VISGDLFSNPGIVTGGALDEPSQEKYLFLLFLFGIPTTLFLSAERVLANFGNRKFHISFIILATVLYSHTLSLLIIFTYHVWRYLLYMGITTPRLLGVVSSVAFWGFVTCFLFWLWGINYNKQPKLVEPVD
jgi:hypothetical protein